MSSFALTYSNQEATLYQTGIGGIKYARQGLPDGLVRMGRINDPAAFAQIIRQALTTAQPSAIKSASIIIGLPEEQAFVKVLELPSRLSKSDLRTAVEYQWQGLLPVTSDQVYFDCAYLPDAKLVKGEKKSTTRRALIVAYPKDIINTLLTVVHQLGITPALFIPNSFGIAKLLSRPDGAATMVIDSTTGQDISITLIQNQATQFSTTLHTRVDDPRLVKQLENIKQFYERNVGSKSIKVANCAVLPSTYSPLLTQQLAQLTIPVENPTLTNVFPGIAQPQSFAPFLSLAGLLKDGFAVSILPPELGDGLEVRRQRLAFRTVSVSMASTLGIVIYLSLVFLFSLQFNAKNRVSYAQQLIDRVTADSKRISQEVTAVNLLINRLAPLASKRSSFTPLIDHIYAEAAKQSVSIGKISMDEPKTVKIDASAQDQSALSAYITGLKTNPAIEQIKQEISQVTDANAPPSVRLVMTIKGTPK